MRPTPIAALLVLTLLAAAPLALAAGETQSEKGRTRADEARAERLLRANDTKADDNATRPDHAAKKADEGAPKGPLAGVRAALQALRDALRVDMGEVRETCHAAEPAGDTKDGRRAWAHCIRDGYHKLFEAFRAQRDGLRA